MEISFNSEIEESGGHNNFQASEVQIGDSPQFSEFLVNIRAHDEVNNSKREQIDQETEQEDHESQNIVGVTESKNLQVDNHDNQTEDHGTSDPQINGVTFTSNEVGFQGTQTEGSNDNRLNDSVNEPEPESLDIEVHGLDTRDIQCRPVHKTLVLVIVLLIEQSVENNWKRSVEDVEQRVEPSVVNVLSREDH